MTVDCRCKPSTMKLHQNYFFLEKWKIRFSIMSYKMDKNGKKIKQNEGWS